MKTLRNSELIFGKSIELNKEEKLVKLKNNLENLLFNLESKKDELHTYLKESELQINTIKNQLHILNNHLYEEESIKNKRKEDDSMLHSVRFLDQTKSEEYKDNEEDDDDEEEDDEEEDDEEEDDDDDIENRIMANIDPNLARLLGMDVKEETKSDWVPPSFSGLHNSSRNSTYDHLYKK
jgi:hypothetical protein